MLIYGVVIGNRFLSSNMDVKVESENGLYSIDVSSKEYLKSIQPADIIEFSNFVKKNKKMEFVNGFSFKDGMIPFNIIKWKRFKIPIYVNNLISDEWEVIKVLYIHHKNVFFYIESLFSKLQNKLFEIKEIFDNKKSIKNIKEVTPEMRILFTFHNFERIRIEKEIEKKKIEEYKKTLEGRLKLTIEEAGGRLISYSIKQGRGYEIIWSSNNETINTFLDNNFRVVEAGFCVSGYDRTQSMGSVVNLLKTYKDQGSHIHRTRV